MSDAARDTTPTLQTGGETKQMLPLRTVLEKPLLEIALPEFPK